MATTPSDCGMSFGSVVIVSKSPRDSLTHSLDDTEANNTPTTSNERLVNNKQNEDEETTKNNNNNNNNDDDDVDVDEELQNIMAKTTNHQFLLCRRSFKDAASGILRNCNSLPLFVYSTSPSTHITSADGVGLSAHATVATHSNIPKYVGRNECRGVLGCPDCLPLRAKAVGHLASIMMAASASANSVANVTTSSSTVPLVYHQPHTLNLNLMHFNNQQLQQQQHEHELSHKTPYSNNYPLHNLHHHHHHHLHNGQHHQQQQQQQPQQQAHQQQLQHSHMHSEQTKSLQELQHEVGALLEFRDLVIETFPDLKHKMASISSTPAATMTTITATSTTTTASNTLTGSCSLSSRREWEPGIRVKRKLSQKEASSSVDSPTTTSTSVVTSNNAQQNGSNGATAVVAAGELSSSSLTRSRSNSHSGKKEPKSAGENNNGSVVQDSGFSTETSSSKEGHSASSNNGAITGPNALHRLSCLESDDELLNLLDVIHRKSNRLREEMEHLQNYEKNHLTENQPPSTAVQALTKSTSHSNALTPRTFREHVERLNKEDIKQLRKERDKLLDKLAEMEAETLSGRIKATQMSNQMEELISVKKDLEEQLKMAMAQKLQLNVRVQQLQQQQQKSSSSQSDSSSQRNFSSSATTVLSAGSGDHTNGTLNRRTHTFQPVVVLEQQQQQQNNGDRSNKLTLGRLDGIVSNPGALNTKCRSIQDSKRIAAILLETNVIELQRHLLTLSVQNQVLMQKLDGATKSKTTLAKRLDKSKEQVEDLCFQLEEKNIELAGTQAQLRIMETRLHANTPSSGAPTNVSSFMQHSSQHEYETNRSSTSTILTLSRRGVVNDSLTASQPTVTQISTPSMKAMVPLAMDDMQQHGSSTESARDARHSNSSQNSANGSAFEQRQQLVGVRVQQTAKKFGGASKPSKIPLPGSKLSTSTTNYFTGKPPSGRPLSAIMSRSPNSTNASTASSSSNKSSLSRSTGNLLLSKSPNSLKRTDSAQSIRRDAVNISGSSLSTQNSRNSMNSSIPLAINTNNLSKSQQQQQQTLSHSTPSTTRVLQNSPLPKPKRESLTSRVRHLDSLSRVHKNNDKDSSFSTPEQQSQLVSSTPKNGSSSGGLVTPVNSETHRKLLNDWATASTGSNNASYMQTLTRRGFRGATNVTTTPTTTTTSTAASNNTNSNVANSARRFSSASMAGSTMTTRLTNRQQDEHKELTQHQKQTQSQQQQQQQQSSDTDSGKHSLLLYHKSPSICVTANKFHFPDPSAMNLWNDYSDDGLELTTTHLYPNSLSLLDANYLTTKTTTWGGNNNNDNIEGLRESDALSGMRNKLLVTFDYGSCSSLAHNGSSLNEFHPLHSAMVSNEIERKYFPNNYNDNNKHDEHDDICTTLWYKALSKQKLTSSDMHFPVHHVQYAAHLIDDSQNSSINNQFTLNNYNNDNDNEDDDIESFHFRNSHKSPIKCISKDSLETYIANDYHDLHELNDENFYDEGEEEPDDDDDDDDDDGGKLISENFYDSIEGL